MEEKKLNEAQENPFWFVDHTFQAAPLGITVVPACDDPGSPTSQSEPHGLLLVSHPGEEADEPVEEKRTGPDGGEYSYEEFVGFYGGEAEWRPNPDPEPSP